MIRSLLVFCFSLLLVPRAWAGWAVVEGLAAPDRLGRWRPVEATGEAVVRHEGVDVPLRRGASVATGDVLKTAQARVELRLESGEHIYVSEQTEIEVAAERGLLQRLGEIYLSLKSDFSVRYGSVEATVEGTKFFVRGDPAGVVQVAVEQGRVRVKVPEGEVAVIAGRASRVTTGKAPTEPTRWAMQAGDYARTWPRSRPALHLDLLATGGLGLDGARPWGATYGVRVGAGIALFPGARLALGAEWSGMGAGRMRVPVHAGLGWELPGVPIQLSGQLSVAYETESAACGGEYQAIHLGGTGSVRGAVPMGRRLSLLGEARGGWTGQPVFDVGLGVGVNL